MTSAFSWQNSISLCPTSFRIPRPNLPVAPGVSWLPTFSFQSHVMKKMSFHYRGLECKSRKSRNTWSNRQIWPWCTEWSRAKANRVLPRERSGHSKHPLPTTQEKTLHMDITRWSTRKSDWLILYSQRWRSSIQSANIRRGADCGSDHELLVAKFRLKLKKGGKTGILIDKINLIFFFF